MGVWTYTPCSKQEAGVGACMRSRTWGDVVGAKTGAVAVERMEGSGEGGDWRCPGGELAVGAADTAVR